MRRPSQRRRVSAWRTFLTLTPASAALIIALLRIDRHLGPGCVAQPL